MENKHQNKYLMFGIVAVIFIFVVGINGCPKAPEPTPLLNITEATPEAVDSVVNANNQFAFELYHKLNEKETGNIFYSPYSISTALAMTYEGARGKTAEEMQSVFHFPENAGLRMPAFASIYNQLNKPNKEYQLNTANALWAQKDYSFLDSYINTIEQFYGGKATELDFVSETEKSRQTINKWVEDQTNNKIKDLIPQGILGPLTRLVLTNAIYFKGNWLTQFDKADTKEADFYVAPDETVKVQMMSMVNKENVSFNYAETENLQVLEMPYSGEELSMLVLLPKENNLEPLNTLTAEKISEIKSQLKEREIDVYIPKFKFETKYFMSDTLAEMGMPTAFSSSADFSGITDIEELYISAVIHQAFVEVNEEGTEAAAATAVVVVAMAPEPEPIFKADHPFMFLIQERETGNILFMGRVMDPTA